MSPGFAERHREAYHKTLSPGRNQFSRFLVGCLILQTPSSEAAGSEALMDYSARKYHQVALDCLNLAEAARDPVIQDQMLRMAERWAKLADRAEERDQSHPAAA